MLQLVIDAAPGEWDFAHSHTGRVENCVRNRCGCVEHGVLTQALCAKWPRLHGSFDENRLQRRNIQHGRRTVFIERLVYRNAVVRVDQELLNHRVAETHNAAPVDLGLCARPVDNFPTVVRCNQFEYGDLSSLHIHFDLGKTRAPRFDRCIPHVETQADGAAFSNDLAGQSLGARTQFRIGIRNDSSRGLVNVGINVSLGIEVRSEVGAGSGVAALARVELTAQINRGVVHSLAVTMDGSACVTDKVPGTRFGIAPINVEVVHRHAEHIGNDHRNASMRICAEVARADGNMQFAVAVHPDEPIADVAATVLLAETHSESATEAPQFLGVWFPAAPADRVRTCLETLFRGDFHQLHIRLHIGFDNVASVQAIPPTELHWIHTECGCNLVHVHFTGKYGLRMAEAAEFTAYRRTGVHRVAVIPVIRHAIGIDDSLSRYAYHRRAA